MLQHLQSLEPSPKAATRQQPDSTAALATATDLGPCSSKDHLQGKLIRLDASTKSTSKQADLSFFS